MKRATLLDRVFEWFQRRCPHDDRWVWADILHGELPHRVVHWCLRCGAHRSVFLTPDPRGGYTETGYEDWNEPRATWATDAPMTRWQKIRARMEEVSRA